MKHSQLFTVSNPFVPNAPLSLPPENIWFFQRVEKRGIGNKWANSSTVIQFLPRSTQLEKNIGQNYRIFFSSEHFMLHFFSVIYVYFSVIYVYFSVIYVYISVIYVYFSVVFFLFSFMTQNCIQMYWIDLNFLLHFSDIFHDRKEHEIISEAMVILLLTLPELSKGYLELMGIIKGN